MDCLQKENVPRNKKKIMEMKKKMQNLTKEQLKAAVEKKKLCNAKAMSIVERLIEPEVEANWLLENVFHINQHHYQDAIEERAIIKCCGYPLCNSSLEDVPKKQYHISTKLNKVYDITDRKNYCSNHCYKASIYLKDQLYTSPLWLRDCEDVIQFKLFSTTNKTGRTGVEVDLGNVSPVKYDNAEADKIDNTSSNKNLSTIEEENQTNYPKTELENENPTSGIHVFEKHELDKFDNSEQSVKNENDKVNKCIVVEKTVGCVVKDIKENSDSVKSIECTDSIEKSEQSRFKQLRKKGVKICNRNQARLLSVGDKVDLFLDSWFTVDSMRFLYGDDETKKVFQEFGTSVEKFGHLINADDNFLYERYAEICKRLNLMELKEKHEDREEEKALKPLPDYETLKSEAKELEIKVRSFYLGDKMVSFQDGADDANNSNEQIKDSSTPILPMIEKHCVIEARRRIVLDKINKTLPDIQNALGLPYFNIRQDIQEFVHTLSLSADNIIFSPPEWNLISIVILKLFTVRNELIDYAFRQDLTQKRIINILLSYKLDLDFLQSCLNKVTNIEQIIKNSQ